MTPRRTKSSVQCTSGRGVTQATWAGSHLPSGRLPTVLMHGLIVDVVCMPTVSNFMKPIQRYIDCLSVAVVVKRLIPIC